MNLVELSEELEFMPKDALIQLSQNPNSNYPPFLVLAEIQRRTQMEKMYAAARPKPQNTVAEEVVTDFAMSTPNAGISMMDGSAPTERFSPKSSDIPAPVLMQTAASGGLTAYANKGQTETTGSKIKRFLTAPFRAIGDLGKLQAEAYDNADRQIRENNSTNADRQNYLITKSLPVIKGEKTLQEFRNEMEELFNNDFVKDDRGYRNQIKNYYFKFEKEFLPRFQKEIAETGQMPKDVISHYDKYENFRNSGRYLNPYDTGYERPDLSLPEKIQKKQGGGLTGYQNRGQTMIEQSLSNPQDRGFFDRTFDYIKENPGSAALNAASIGLMFVPGVGLVSLGLRGLQAARALNYAKGAKKAYDVAKRGAQATVTRPKIATRFNTNQPLGEAAKSLGITGNVTNLGRQFSPLRAGTTATIGATGLQGIKYGMQDDKVINEMPPPERELSAEEKELLRLQNEMAMAQTETKPKGFDDQALNLISLGGTIMGARNMSELGQGLTSFATAKQAAKGDEAQQAYYAASAAKAQAEVENMPLDRVISSIEAITEQQEAALENNDTETATALGLQLQILNQRALELQGIDVQTQASIDKNLIASFGT